MDKKVQTKNLNLDFSVLGFREREMEDDPVRKRLRRLYPVGPMTDLPLSFGPHHPLVLFPFVSPTYKTVIETSIEFIFVL